MYERAEANDDTAWKLYQLETQALAECRDHMGMVSPKLEAKGFDALSITEKEMVIAQLGGIGLMPIDRKTDIQDKTIIVMLSLFIQNVMACTFFNLLNRLEKLEGALNEKLDGRLNERLGGRLTLHLLAPRGGENGLVQ